MVYSTRQFVLCLTLCHFVLVFFSPFSIAITSLGEEGANLSAFHTFVRFVLVWICLFSLPLGVWEGLRFVIVALPGLFSYLFFYLVSEFFALIKINILVFFGIIEQRFLPFWSLLVCRPSVCLSVRRLPKPLNNFSSETSEPIFSTLHAEPSERGLKIYANGHGPLS